MKKTILSIATAALFTIGTAYAQFVPSQNAPAGQGQGQRGRGPGDGTGNKGNGPKDGSGWGKKSGGGPDCDQTGPKGNRRSQQQGRGGRR